MSLRHWGPPGKPLIADGQASGTGILEKARPGERKKTKVERGKRKTEEKEENQVAQEACLKTPVKALEIL